MVDGSETKLALDKLDPSVKWIGLTILATVVLGLGFLALAIPGYRTSVVWTIRVLVAVQIPIVIALYLRKMMLHVSEEYSRADSGLLATENISLYNFTALFLCTVLGLESLFIEQMLR